MFLAQRWRRQPSYPVEIDASHPIARDLRFFVTYVGGGFREQVRGVMATRNGTGTTTTAGSVGKTGTAVVSRMTSAGADYLEVAHDPSYSITGDLSLLVGANIRTGSAYRALLNKHTGNGSLNNPFDFRTDNSGTPILQLIRADGSGNQSISGPAVTLNAHKQYGVTSFIGSTAVSFYRDGIPSNQLAAAPVSVTSNTGTLRLGRRADGATQMDGDYEFGAGWARVLREEEFKALAENPWQLFKPIQRRIYMNVVAGGGGSFQAAWAVAANAVTSTGARAA